MKFERLSKYRDGQFRRITGVRRSTFEKMVEILKKAYSGAHERRGRRATWAIEDMLLATLEYLREYRTYAHIAASYGLSESTVCRRCRWVENILVKDGAFSLPGKKALLQNDTELDVVLIDATETPIERPKRRQKRYYSGKKKRHMLKTQVVVDKKTRKIICLAQCFGSMHDFRLFKCSEVRCHPNKFIETDTGYVGIDQLHANSVLPRKKSKHHPLTRDDKRFNREVSRERVSNEHAIGFLKRFRILSERYRNRRKRFGLRFHLIAGICNYDLNP